MLLQQQRSDRPRNNRVQRSESGPLFFLFFLFSFCANEEIISIIYLSAHACACIFASSTISNSNFSQNNSIFGVRSNCGTNLMIIMTEEIRMNSKEREKKHVFIRRGIIRVNCISTMTSPSFNWAQVHQTPPVSHLDIKRMILFLSLSYSADWFEDAREALKDRRNFSSYYIQHCFFAIRWRRDSNM